MKNLCSLLSLLPLLATSALAATADEWRSRSIYQVITDRFAPPNGDNGTPCNTDDRRYCGGTWQTVISKLDYIQGMGYDAVWISPTALTLEGKTIYGEGYHGYWTTDPTKLNPHFGGADDLKALSSALHSRGMFLMVDVAINNLVSQTKDITDESLATASDGTLLFKKREHYHPPCNIAWNNRTSERECWLATSGVMLMDLNQDNQEVHDTILNWVPRYVQEYGIDGFRVDATKHMTKKFQGDLCRAAGNLFCMGEVAGDDTQFAASFMGGNGIDSVFGFGMLNGFVKTFSGSSPSPMSTLAGYIDKANAYPDQSLVGAFLDNQDLARFNALVNDKTKVHNAIVGTFLYAGIPAIYYGLEQDIADGTDDPANRNALWLYNGFSTESETYKRIAKLNQIRHAWNKDDDWLRAHATVVDVATSDIALKRGNLMIVLTNRGSGAPGTWAAAKGSFEAGSTVYDLLSCETVTATADGSVPVTWTSGQPFVFASTEAAASAGLCDATAGNATSSSLSSSASASSATSASILPSASLSSGSVSPTASSPQSVSVSPAPISTEIAVVTGGSGPDPEQGGPAYTTITTDGPNSPGPSGGLGNGEGGAGGASGGGLPPSNTGGAVTRSGLRFGVACIGVLLSVAIIL